MAKTQVMKGTVVNATPLKQGQLIYQKDDKGRFFMVTHNECRRFGKEDTLVDVVDLQSGAVYTNQPVKCFVLATTAIRVENGE